MVRGQPSSRVCAPDDPQACAQPVGKGEAAPFDGQLITLELALKLGQKAERCESAIQAERDRGAELVLIERELGEAQVKIERDARYKDRDYLFAELEKQKLVPWYKAPLFVMTTTFLVTAGIFSLLIFAR